MNKIIVAEQNNQVKTNNVTAGNFKQGDPFADKDAPVPLGVASNIAAVMIWSRKTDQLLELKSTSVTAKENLILLAEKSWIMKYFKKETNKGFVEDWQTAGMAILDQCSTLRGFDSQQHKMGTGVWLSEDENLIINGNDFCLDANQKNIDRIDISRKRKTIYDSTGIVSPPPPLKDVTNEEITEVINKLVIDLQTWEYEDPEHWQLVLSWICMNTYLGALKRRPSMWLIAPAGSGKTALHDYIEKIYGSYAITPAAGSGSTIAGVLQFLKNSAGPIIMDETETAGTSMDTASVKGMLKHQRASYSSQNKNMKGTQDQSGKLFQTTANFLFISISDPNLEPADASRIIKVKLKARNAADKTPEPVAFTERQQAVFFWYMISCYTAVQKDTDLIRELYAEVHPTADAREKDTYCTALSAGTAVTQKVYDKDHSTKALRTLISSLTPCLEEIRAQRKDHELCLEALMNMSVSVQEKDIDANGYTRVANYTELLPDIIYKIEQDNDKDHAGRYALAMLGITVTKREDGRQWLAIARKNRNLAEKLARTRWKDDGSWVASLKEHPDANMTSKPRISGISTNCISIPVSSLGIEDKDNDKDNHLT
jgi:hypothetical protein